MSRFSQALAPLTEEFISPLRSAFMAREPRERWLIIICGLFIVVFGWYNVIQKPLQQEQQRYQKINAQDASTLAWMRGAAAQIKAQGGSSTATANTGSLLSLADSSLRRSGLGDALQRIQPDDENNVKIWLENAKFDNILPWLAQMENQALTISVAGFTPANGSEKNGLVNARITLSRGP